MPLAHDKLYLFVDGKKEDVSGASLCTPEWNQQDLVQGEQQHTRSCHRAGDAAAAAAALSAVLPSLCCVQHCSLLCARQPTLTA
jgi:hypothetical protein